ncbi:MAG TPA: hypothetical protein VGG33_03560, partial [Polyangia bacterium]
MGDVFYKTTVTGGETFELYLQANKGAADTAITPAIYSSDPSKNLLADCSTPGHLAAPLQDMQQQQTNTWSIRWEAPHSSNSSYNADYNDLVVLAQVQAPCNPAQGTCQPPEALVSAHTGGAIDNLNDGAFSGLAGASIPVASFGDPTGGEGSTVPLGLSTVLGGRVDNVRWSFVQEGVDFSLTPPTNGSGLLSGGFDVLEVRRIHRPRAEGWTSSFGPGVFSPFDAKLAIRPSAIGSQSRIEFFDPSSDAPPIIFSELSAQDGDAVVDGRYRDQTRTYASLTLLNASSTVVADTSLATRAVVSRFSGEKLVFDIIDTHTGGAPALYGRLTAAEDRSGNATTVQYVHPADASDSQLSGDRSRLWLMQSLTDMHGASASFAYQFRSGSSRWVVQTVTPPAGGAIQYQYGNDSGNLDRLTGVNYPNGDASEFSRTWDAPSNTWALSLKDASGEGVRAWKTVYLTPASFTGAGGVLRRQEPNLVKRITNASGQTVHELQEDPNDARVTYVRQGSGRLFRMKVDNLGVPAETAVATSSPSNPLAASFVVQESYGTNAFGMIERAIDALGKTRVFTRHPNTGALTGLSARDGTTATLVTNDVGQVSRTIDRAGRVNDFLYDEKGRAKTLTRAAGTGDIGVWTYEYNSRGQVVKATDANNHVTDYAYDPQGRLLTITLPADLPGGVRPVTTFEYYPSGQLHASTDADARRTEYEYDSRGRLALTRYPDLTTETITYGTGAFVGLVESTTNRKGIITTFEYDTSHRLTKTTNAAGRPEASTTTLTYVPGTELVATQTTDGNRAEFTYDSSGRQISRRVYTDATHSLLSTKAWDAANDRVVAETDPYGRRVHFAYDSAGRLVRTVRELVPQGVPAGANISALARITTPNPAYVIEESIYDGRNQVVETVDARGTRTVNTYDQQGRLEAVTEAAGTSLARPRSFEYDAAGNMVAEIRPRLNAQGQVLKTSHTYTQRNLRLSSTEAAGTSLAATTSYTYTLSGATKTVTDPRGAVTTSNYDVNGRLGSTVDALQKTTSYTYDAVGNRLTTSNALGTVLTSTYDGLNRVLTETNALNETTTYTYDDDLTDGAGLDDIYSNLGSLGLGTNAPGRAVRTTNAMSESRLEVSDGAGRPILAVDAAGKETRQTYDVVIGGLLESSVVSPSGATTKTRADGAGRARTSVDPAGFQTVRTFDAGGNQKSVRDPNNVGEDCSFDVLGRRTSCVDTQGDSTGWEYDTENNQTASIDGRQVRSTCAFDGRNRKASCTDGIGATTTWAYDANSNITDITDAEGKVTHYEYNLRNQRTETKYADSSGPNDKVVVTYDDVGRLHTSTDQAGNTKTFIYNNANRLLERR